MVIYEVNLLIDDEIYNDYYEWLKVHIQEMLVFKGFILCDIFEIESDKKELSVQYKVKSREDLEDYFLNHAEKMRNGGIKKFTGKFSANRRILKMI